MILILYDFLYDILYTFYLISSMFDFKTWLRHPGGLRGRALG